MEGGPAGPRRELPGRAAVGSHAVFGDGFLTVTTIRGDRVNKAFLDYLALVILILGLTLVFYAFIYIHDLPYKIAKKRQHPHAEAIHVACWLSLFTLHALWPFVYIWAVMHPKTEEDAARGKAAPFAGRRDGRGADRPGHPGRPARGATQDGRGPRSRRQLIPKHPSRRHPMVELIVGTYGVLCWLLFKKFKVVPVTTYTVVTAFLAGA